MGTMRVEQERSPKTLRNGYREVYRGWRRARTESRRRKAMRVLGPQWLTNRAAFGGLC